MYKFRYLIHILLCVIMYTFSGHIKAQELSCNIKIISSKIQTTDKAIFENLERSLNELVNQRRWTEAEFLAAEKIDCTMTIVINQMPQENQFQAEIQITSRRPVYGTTYNTPIFNFKDNSLNFNYQDMQQIEFNETYIQDNLTALIAYYVYIILGYDFDTFSPYGGEALFRKAESIVNAAQSLGETGWKAFENDRNRHALVTALLDEKMKPMRELSYNYHRMGLDEMTKNPEQIRAKIMTYLKTLNKIYEINPSNVLLQLFIDTKLDEIVNIFLQGSPSEKKTVYELLQLVAPTLSHRYQKLGQ